MKKRCFSLVVLPLLVASFAFAAPGKKSQAPRKNAPEKVTEFIVSGSADSLAKVRAQLPAARVRLMYSEGEQAVVRRMGQPDLAATLVVTLPAVAQLEALERAVRKQKLDVAIEPNSRAFYVLKDKRSRARVDGGGKRQANQEDELFHLQWGLDNKGYPQKDFLDEWMTESIPGKVGEDVNLPAGTNLGQGVTVAVLDTGADLKHQDIHASILSKPAECQALRQMEACKTGVENAIAECMKKPDAKKPACERNKIRDIGACETTAAKIDADGNGYPLDCQGWNFMGKKLVGATGYGNPYVFDDISHGTHVSGIIAAQANAIGVRGVAPRARILPVQVITDNPTDPSGGVIDPTKQTTLIDIVARGLTYAIANKVDVINLSLGWNGRADSPVIRKLIAQARAQGIVIVASAGNDSTDALVFPCAYPGVVCVGAHGPDGNLVTLSNYGSGVDIAAPGYAILSTIPLKDLAGAPVSGDVYTAQAGYDYKNGTSMATPFVTGAIAILRSQGYSANESIARLLAGARVRPFVQSKMVLSGNLDIAGALQAKPRPYIIPSEKTVVPALWERPSRRIPVEFDLENLWADGRDVDLSLRLSDADSAIGAAGIAGTSHWNFPTWKSGDKKTIQFEIDVRDERISSALNFILSVRPANGETQTIRVPVQVSVALVKETDLPGARTLLVKSGKLLENASLRTIVSMDGSAAQDYLAFVRGPESLDLQLIREVGGAYEIGATKSLPPAGNSDLRVMQRLDLNFDGKPDYAFSYFVRPEGDSVLPGFRFEFYDDQLNELYPPYTYRNETAFLDLQNFQWIRSGDRLVPAWIYRGETPQAERGKPNYWKPHEYTEMLLRLYYLDPSASDGVRSLAAPKGLGFVATLNQTLDQRRRGVVPVILDESDDFVTTFHTAEMAPGIASPVAQKVDMKAYSNLRSMTPIALYPVGRTAAWEKGLGFFGDYGVAKYEVAALVPGANGAHSVQSTVIQPESSKFGDEIVNIIATFRDVRGGGVATYAQSYYDIRYRDWTTGSEFTTSLRRYSFLASQLFYQTMYGAVAESRGERLPAISIPDGFGAYPGAEAIVPARDARGVTIGLIRPAALRVQVLDENCESLGRLEPTALDPTQAVYFCGDRFIRLPYRF